jgi:hypothetical protein
MTGSRRDRRETLAVERVLQPAYHDRPRYDTINVTLPGFPQPLGSRLAKLTWLAGQG